MATKVLFSFDSEDYTTPEAADAERWWAEAMTRHGITACVCVVAELARRLHERGRDDVLAAWEKHEVAYHTDFHSRPPTPAQYLNGCGWEDGVATAMAREGKGIADLEALTGQHPSAFCKPGSSWGPQICAAMSRMGIPIFADSPFYAEKPAQPLRYAGQLLLYYHIHFDGYMSEPEGRLERMKRDFEARLEEHKGGYLIMYTHPCRLVTDDFWDGVNFSHGANPPRESWQPAPLRSPETVQAMAQDFDEFLGWVAAHPEVELTTYRRLAEDYRESPVRSVEGGTVLALLGASLQDRSDGGFDWAVLENAAYSPAEILGLAAALANRGKAGELPTVPLRRLLGPAEESPKLTEPVEVSVEALRAGLREADASMSETGRVPASVRVGSVDVGPGTLLRTVRTLLSLEMESGGRGLERIRLEPGPELPAFARSRNMERLRFQESWVIFPPEFQGENVITQAKLQSWTAKPALPA